MTRQLRGNGHHERYDHQFHDRSPEEIQRELDATRRDMANTIQAIEETLSSRQLMTRAIDYLRGGPLRFSQNFGETVVNNPIPVALIGIGLIWLARADAQGGHLRFRPETSEQVGGVKEKIGGMKEKLSHTTERAREKMSHTKERAHVIGERARDLRARSGERVRRSIGVAQQAWHENPIMVGMLALAGGAVLAAVIPATRREREIIGPRRDRLVEGVKRTAESAVEGAKSGVQSVKREGEVGPLDEPFTSQPHPEDYPVR